MVIDPIENLPMLLDFHHEANTLIFRVDNNGLFDFTDRENAIELIKLDGVDLTPEELYEAKGFLFEYEFQQEDGQKQLVCFINYHVNEKIIPFTSSTISSSPYERCDLIQKGDFLSRHYVDLSQRHYTEELTLSALKDKLDLELTNEIERAQKKANHFLESDIDRSHNFTHERKILDKFLRILRS